MPRSAVPPSGLRAATRRAVQAEISKTALVLFTEHGFEQTTVDQIAAAAGMSSRSVFRYFATKEDMVVGSMAEVGAEISDALESRPRQEPAWEALRRALDGPLQELRDNEAAALAQTALMATTPALRAAQSQKHAQWTELLVPGIARHLRGNVAAREFKARAIAAAVLACLDVAVEEWSRSDGSVHLDKLLDRAISAVRN
jgi:AcrR family transcriptional regulator